MIQVYLPYLLLIMFACVVVGSLGGYLLGTGFRNGSTVDTNQFNILLKAEQNKREKLQAELDEEIKHSKQLEGALETVINENSDGIKKTFTEMHKGHNKILIDPESNKAKIPVRGIFKRRKLGKRSK